MQGRREQPTGQRTSAGRQRRGPPGVSLCSINQGLLGAEALTSPQILEDKACTGELRLCLTTDKAWIYRNPSASFPGSALSLPPISSGVCLTPQPTSIDHAEGPWQPPPLDGCGHRPGKGASREWWEGNHSGTQQWGSGEYAFTSLSYLHISF